MSPFQSDLTPLKEIVLGDSTDQIHTFRLHPSQGAPWAPYGTGYWIALKEHDKISAEGMLLIPSLNPSDTSRLIVFEPGMPGRSAIRNVEERHAPLLLQKGYHLLILRHLGAFLESEDAAAMIHCPERIRIGKKLGEETLGEQQKYNVEEIAHEVVTAVNTVGKAFDEIRLVGHSSGALGHLRSIPQLEEGVRSRITHIVSLAGLTGGIENMRWLLKNFGLKPYLKRCGNLMNMVSPETNVTHLRHMFNAIYDYMLPEHIMLIQVNTPKDEYIHPNAPKRYQDYQGRGLNIRDETQTAKKYHYLQNLRPETLERFLTIYHPSAKHSVTFCTKEPKKKR